MKYSPGCVESMHEKPALFGCSWRKHRQKLLAHVPPASWSVRDAYYFVLCKAHMHYWPALALAAGGVSFLADQVFFCCHNATWVYPPEIVQSAEKTGLGVSLASIACLWGTHGWMRGGGIQMYIWSIGGFAGSIIVAVCHSQLAHALFQDLWDTTASRHAGFLRVVGVGQSVLLSCSLLAALGHAREKDLFYTLCASFVLLLVYICLYALFISYICVFSL